MDWVRSGDRPFTANGIGHRVFGNSKLKPRNPVSGQNIRLAA
ncbi:MULTISPECIES: hypothetical protein [unclassified Microcoleus]|nr:MULTISPECIES: hypothetical protein [unclassified Microcoleus]